MTRFNVFLLTSALALTSLATFAQPNPNPNAPNGGPQPGPSGVPIDGGLGLLTAAGAAWAIRHLRAERQAPPQLPPDNPTPVA